MAQRMLIDLSNLLIDAILTLAELHPTISDRLTR
jgi:hypothetical protein